MIGRLRGLSGAAQTALRQLACLGNVVQFATLSLVFGESEESIYTLLRVLQEQEFERLGSTYTRQVDVRVVAATNQDLATLVAEKQFRMDLYYRLNVFPIVLPPVRQRPEDIPMLVAHFVHRYAERMSKPISRIAKSAMETLLRYQWPGNIRELQNFVERAVILTVGDVLQLPELPSHLPIQIGFSTLVDATLITMASARQNPCD